MVSPVESYDRIAEPSSGGCMPGKEGIRAGCPVWGSPGNRAIAAPQQPALVDIIEIVTLQDGREILPFRLHLPHPAAPWRDPQISGLDMKQVQVKG